mgnify:CR=1 FL=1
MTAFTTRYAPEHASLLEILMTPLQRRKRRELLDLRELPDHLKRDIGILDGHDTPRRTR